MDEEQVQLIRQSTANASQLKAKFMQQLKNMDGNEVHIQGKLK